MCEVQVEWHRYTTTWSAANCTPKMQEVPLCRQWGCALAHTWGTEADEEAGDGSHGRIHCTPDMNIHMRRKDSASGTAAIE